MMRKNNSQRSTSSERRVTRCDNRSTAPAGGSAAPAAAPSRGVAWYRTRLPPKLDSSGRPPNPASANGVSKSRRGAVVVRVRSQVRTASGVRASV